MIEIYKDIRDEVKEDAEKSWNLIMTQYNSIKALSLLNDITNYFKHIYTPEEIEFLQFYFRMKMEMMKE